MPRVLFVDHAGVLGGAELYLLDIVRHLKEQSHVILFEGGPFLDQLEQEGISVSVLEAPDSVMGVERSGGRLHDLKSIPGIADMVMRLRKIAVKYDVVYANSQKALVIGSMAGRLARRPIIWNLHDILTADHFSASHRKLGVFLANRFVDRVIVNSLATKNAFVESGGQEGKTRVIYNGIDPSLFTDIEEDEEKEVRRNLKIHDGTVVGVFSRLAPWKGQHVLLEALVNLPDVHALLVGGALFQDDRAYETKLRALVQRFDLSDRVHFMGFRKDVPRLMKSVDIVLHCSTSPEPFGRVIVEGMLAGKPVIASNAGGAKEIIEDGKTGLLIPPEKPEALVHAIKHLQEHYRETIDITRAGYASALERFSVQNIVREVETQIRKVAGDSHVHSYFETSTTPV